MDVSAFGRKSALFLCTLFFITSASPLFSATQGKVGKTSSGSFRISLVVHPTLTTHIETSEDSSSEVAETLSVNQASRFCVTGRGISEYSLSVKNLPVGTGHKLVLMEPSGQESTLNSHALEKFDTRQVCKDSSDSLIVKTDPLNKSQQLPTAIDLVIQAE